MKQPKKLITDLAQPYLFAQMEWETFIMIRELLKHNWTRSTWDLVSKNFMVRFQQQNKLAHAKIHHLTWERDDAEFKTTSNISIRLLTGNFLSLLAVFPQSFIPHMQALIKLGNEDIICFASLTVLRKPTDVVKVVFYFSASHFHALPSTFSAVHLGLLLRSCELILLSQIFAFLWTFT